MALVWWQIFGGLLVNITMLGDWLSWLQYFSLTRYSLNVRARNYVVGSASFAIV